MDLATGCRCISAAVTVTARKNDTIAALQAPQRGRKFRADSRVVARRASSTLGLCVWLSMAGDETGAQTKICDDEISPSSSSSTRPSPPPRTRWASSVATDASGAGARLARPPRVEGVTLDSDVSVTAVSSVWRSAGAQTTAPDDGVRA